MEISRMRNGFELSTIIDWSATSTPEKKAIITQNEHITYGTLLERAERLARILNQQAFFGQRVATLLPNCIEQILCYLASFKAGSILVPINYRYKFEEISNVIKDAGAKLLIVHEDKINEINKVDLASLGVKVVRVGTQLPDIEDQILNVCTAKEESIRRVDTIDTHVNSPALIIYTSASTGISKGVVHSYSGLSAIIQRYPVVMDLDDKSMSLVNMLICHVTGLQLLMATLAVGGSVILYPPFDITAMKDALMRFPITAMAEPIPMIFDLFHDLQCSPRWFQHMKTVLVGGNKLPKGLQEKCIQLLGKPFYTFYGITEATHLTFNKGERFDKLYSIGKPRDDVQIKLVDDDDLEVSEGCTGEICFKTDRAMLGYWNNKEANAEVFLLDGFIRTGDLGRIDKEGFYWFMGRKKHLIIRGASNISPIEVEEVIERHPDVISSLVIGVFDEREVEVPKAYVILKKGSDVTRSDIHSWTRERLADYKVPKFFEIVEQFPVGKTGKIDYLMLKASRVPVVAQ